MMYIIIHVSTSNFRTVLARMIVVLSVLYTNNKQYTISKESINDDSLTAYKYFGNEFDV